MNGERFAEIARETLSPSFNFLTPSLFVCGRCGKAVDGLSSGARLRAFESCQSHLLAM